MADARIVAYITDSKEKILAGEGLCLLIPPGEERDDTVRHLGMALKAGAIQLKSGDIVLVTGV